MCTFHLFYAASAFFDARLALSTERASVFSRYAAERSFYMYIVDMHCDSLLEVNAERGLKNAYNLSREYPQLQFFAEFVPCEGKDPAERRRMLMHYLDVYISERARLDLVPIFNCHDLNFAMECERYSSLLSLEGGGGLFADSEELITLYRAGLRVLGIAWDTNELATASSDPEDRGLTDAGRALIQKASEMGIILDVSHLSDRSTAELLEFTPYPVIATHSNFREVTNTPRNLPRSLASAITKRGGVIGLNLYPPTLREGGRATLDDILRHVDFALENYGENSLGFGFDIDGTDGEYPEGLGERSSIHDRVTDLLLSHYSASVVEKIAGGNVINFLKCNL